MKVAVVLAAVTALFVSAVRAGEFSAERLENWPQWRGPHANGAAPNADPPIEWSEQKNVRWKTEIPGKGSATPIVWKDQVFVLTAIPTDRKSKKPAAADTNADTDAGREERP
ncbi:MAG: PQQ-binding-like beta-propeller repeat protein, partial [Planctomycetaceae bacterium]